VVDNRASELYSTDMEITTTTPGKIIAYLRRKKRLSQENVAKLVPCSLQYYRDIERDRPGRCNASVPMQKAIAAAFGVHHRYIWRKHEEDR